MRQLPGEDRDARQAGQVQPPLTRGGCGGEPPQRPAESQGGPDEQGGGMGIRAVVEAGGVLAGRIPDGHGQGRGGRAQPGTGHPRPPPAAGAQDRGQDERPDQVELLLDGQGPEVLQRRGRPEHREVRLVTQRLPPVARVGDGGQQAGPQRRQLIWLEHGDRGRDGGQHHRQAGQQPAGPADPEAAQVKPAAVVPRGGQQVSDQVSADDEEHVHAEEPAGQPEESLVEGQHRQHRDPAQPVQAGNARTGARGSGPGGRPPGTCPPAVRFPAAWAGRARAGRVRAGRVRAIIPRPGDRGMIARSEHTAIFGSSRPGSRHDTP